VSKEEARNLGAGALRISALDARIRPGRGTRGRWKRVRRRGGNGVMHRIEP
jgi:hypothetical protein